MAARSVRTGPLRGSLHRGARADRLSDFRGADFNAFGSLPALAARPETELLNDSVKAESPGTRLGDLECLFERDRISGPLVGQCRLVGIFTLAAGVDDVTWGSRASRTAPRPCVC